MAGMGDDKTHTPSFAYMAPFFQQLIYQFAYQDDIYQVNPGSRLIQ
jgi:hypothetical protein